MISDYDSIEESMTVSWWNSKTIKRSGMTDSDWRSHVAVAADVAFCLLNKGVDLLALGEVDTASMQILSYVLHQNGLDDFETICCDGASVGKSTRGCFDLGAIYRPSRMSLVQNQCIVHDHAGAKLKVAVRLKFTVGAKGDPFYFFISHWPSRRFGDAKDKRVEAAVKLKASVEDISVEMDEMYPENKDASLYPYIVLLGDYNDEPFDVSLSNRLHACRDRSLAARKIAFSIIPIGDFLEMRRLARRKVF